MNIYNLRKIIQEEEIDYLFLMRQFIEYQAPRSKIMRLINSGDLIRVKKGLYIFGDEHRLKPIHSGLLGNIIYGPSYISKEYALSIHGMIPERVETVTCMTIKKNKTYHTPVGTFTYQHLHKRRYSIGIDWVKIEEGRHYYLASPEKALADMVFSIRSIQTKKEMAAHLIENLRIDEQSLWKLNPERMHRISLQYRNPVVTLLKKTLNREF